jgi:hypothetical protein
VDLANFYHKNLGATARPEKVSLGSNTVQIFGLELRDSLADFPTVEDLFSETLQ